MQFAFQHSTRRYLYALWHRGLTLVVCLSLLHLPVPVLHRHDEIESAGVLACHLTSCHSRTHYCCLSNEATETGCECPGIHDSHWHFVLPSQRGDDDAPEHGIPHAETEFVAFAGSSPTSVSATDGQAFECVGSVAPVCCYLLGKLEHSSDHWDQCGRAAAGMQVYRRALSCVMRC